MPERQVFQTQSKIVETYNPKSDTTLINEKIDLLQHTNTLNDKPEYQLYNDPTITRCQSRKGGFKPEALTIKKEDNFYVDGTKLANGQEKRGYHEAVVPRELFYFMRDLKDDPKIIETSEKTKSLGFETSYKFSENQIAFKTIYENADSFRTDTEITVLSSELGMASGHSTSGHKDTRLSTNEEGHAHKLIVKSMTNILNQKDGTVGLTEKSIICAMASIFVSSIAPGELANTVKGGVANFHEEELQNWEKKRNESKARVDSIFNSLTTDEQNFVRTHTDEYIKSTIKLENERSLDKYRSTSPYRETTLKENARFGGGKYTGDLGAYGPIKRPPQNSSYLGLYITEPFRAERRKPQSLRPK